MRTKRQRQRPIYTPPERRYDVLERERCNVRISEAAYLIGRDIEEKFALASHLKGYWPRQHIDESPCYDPALAKRIQVARGLIAYGNRIQIAVGTADALLIRDVLCNSTDYAELAGSYGRNGVSRFCSALERLADAWAARGT